ncbi:hypothetical protein NM688_g6367 [Phlebia brevispora]|uniref:Uncharacterized protein n=1 Tax=Phlebia brevispora TaxID=194682 RepID=A0ACC1SGM6_9APHY|nr:hypothetical protein NM688_g6367 [Phlebia brevispora]
MISKYDALHSPEHLTTLQNREMGTSHLSDQSDTEEVAHHRVGGENLEHEKEDSSVLRYPTRNEDDRRVTIAVLEESLSLQVPDAIEGRSDPPNQFGLVEDDSVSRRQSEEYDELHEDTSACSLGVHTFVPKPLNMNKYRSWKSIPGLPRHEIPAIRKMIRTLRKVYLEGGKPWSLQPESAMAACPCLRYYEDAWPVIAVTREHLAMSNYRKRRQRTARISEALQEKQQDDPSCGHLEENGSDRKLTPEDSGLVYPVAGSNDYATHSVVSPRATEPSESLSAVIQDRTTVEGLGTIGIATLDQLLIMAQWTDERTRSFLKGRTGLSEFQIENILHINETLRNPGRTID